MLAFSQWPGACMEVASEGCRALRWAPPPRFAPYIARPVVLPRRSPPLQVDDEDSSGGSSPERGEGSEGGEMCGWRGCGVQFPSVTRLSAHVSRAHAHPHHDGLFYCGWQGCTRPQRGFNARYKMLVHVRTHTNERPHTCTQCHKSFSRAENLKIHLRSHSGEKPYVCPYEGCGKAYSNSSDRFKHTRTHTVDKPYCCKVLGCNKRYTDPSSLRKHVKTYKHFTPKTPSSSESSTDQGFVSSEHPSKEASPQRDTQKDTYKPYAIEPRSPPRVTTLISPTIGASNYSNIPPMNECISPVGSPIRYSPIRDQVTYLKPLEPVMYPIRVPSYEMSYIEYTQMYEHAYRTYYSNSRPLTTPPIYEKAYAYDNNAPFNSTNAEERVENFRNSILPKYGAIIDDEEMPLNLKRSEHRVNYRKESIIVSPIEESMDNQLVKCMDLPLDLSTKS